MEFVDAFLIWSLFAFRNGAIWHTRFGPSGNLMGKPRNQTIQPWTPCICSRSQLGSRDFAAKLCHSGAASVLTNFSTQFAHSQKRIAECLTLEVCAYERRTVVIVRGARTSLTWIRGGNSWLHWIVLERIDRFTNPTAFGPECALRHHWNHTHAHNELEYLPSIAPIAINSSVFYFHLWYLPQYLSFGRSIRSFGGDGGNAPIALLYAVLNYKQKCCFSLSYHCSMEKNL